jgi:hypothetical protein
MFTVLVLNGRPTKWLELMQLLPQIEIFDRVEGASEEVTEFVAERAPHLLPKLRRQKSVAPAH